MGKDYLSLNLFEFKRDAVAQITDHGSHAIVGDAFDPQHFGRGIGGTLASDPADGAGQIEDISSVNAHFLSCRDLCFLEPNRRQKTLGIERGHTARARRRDCLAV